MKGDVMARPKGSYFSRLPNGDILNISLWSGKSDPKQRSSQQKFIVTVQILNGRQEEDLQSTDLHWEATANCLRRLTEKSSASGIMNAVSTLFDFTRMLGKISYSFMNY
jgi:hypothetical protein